MARVLCSAWSSGDEMAVMRTLLRRLQRDTARILGERRLGEEWRVGLRESEGSESDGSHETDSYDGERGIGGRDTGYGGDGRGQYGTTGWTPNTATGYGAAPDDRRLPTETGPTRAPRQDARTALPGSFDREYEYYYENLRNIRDQHPRTQVRFDDGERQHTHPSNTYGGYYADDDNTRPSSRPTRQNPRNDLQTATGYGSPAPRRPNMALSLAALSLEDYGSSGYVRDYPDGQRERAGEDRRRYQAHVEDGSDE